MKSLLLAILSLALVLGGCASVATDGTPPLRVASDLDNLPFAGVDENGAPCGRDVEMMQELAARLGRELEWRRMPFDRLLEAVETGEADVVCATMGITSERSRRVRFTRPYYRTALGVTVRSGAGEPATLAELAGLRVFASIGTTSEEAVRRDLPTSIGVFVPEAGDDLATWLASGELDAAVMDGPACDALVAHSAGRLARLAEDLGAELYGLALPRDRAALAAQLDRALEEMERTGRLAELDAEYGVPTAAAKRGLGALRATLEELYDAFGFDAGGEPDWAAQRRIFLEGASFVAPIRPGAAPVAVDAEEFLHDFAEFVRTGPYSATGLHERILGVHADSFGGVAHALVAFEGHRPGEDEALTRGLDSLQLVHDGGRWRLVSFTTQYEDEALPLPPRFRRPR